jgi:hypothetical protein
VIINIIIHNILVCEDSKYTLYLTHTTRMKHLKITTVTPCCKVFIEEMRVARDLGVLQRWWRRFRSYGMLHRIDRWIVPDFSKDSIAFIFRLKQSELSLLTLRIRALHSEQYNDTPKTVILKLTGTQLLKKIHIFITPECICYPVWHVTTSQFWRFRVDNDRILAYKFQQDAQVTEFI